MKSIRRLVGIPVLTTAVLGAMAVAGCEMPDWLGEPQAPPLPGERISVLSLEASLEPDPTIADVTVRLPRPWRNTGWPQAGGLPDHALHHLELGDALQRRWSIDIGAGSARERRLLAQPVILNGRVFAMDSEASVSAFAVDSGRKLWVRNITPKREEEGAIGGGLAVVDGVVYATTGYGFVHALAAETGEDVWSQDIGIPFRGAPTVAGGRVFAITYDNQLHVLAAEDGSRLWSHSGLPEDASLVGSPSVAVAGDVAVAPFSSGELYALRVENGRVIWSDQLIRSAQLTPLSALSAIRGNPVIDREIVIAVSHSGRLAAIDMRSGRRLWDRDVEGVEMPWVAGDFIYLVTTNGEVLCLARRGGRIRWVTQLQRYEDPEDKEGPIHWSGPVLASDRLILAGSNGRVVAVSPYTGEVMGEIESADGVLIPPVVADGVLYILSDDGTLAAYE